MPSLVTRTRIQRLEFRSRGSLSRAGELDGGHFFMAHGISFPHSHLQPRASFVASVQSMFVTLCGSSR